MARTLSPTLQVTAGALVRRVRELPLQGEVLVAPGSRVGAADIVARAELPNDLIVLRLAESLGIEAAEALAHLQVREGDAVAERQLLIERRGLFGLFQQRIRAPADGIVEFIARRSGHLGLRLPPNSFELAAYIAGSVVETVPGKSVTIESRAALCQGIFGVGGERHGKLRMVEAERHVRVEPKELPSDMAGAILFGGAAWSLAALQSAAQGGAVAVVTGSVDDATLNRYVGRDISVAVTGDEDVPLTLVVTEGFGFLPLAERVLTLLSKLDGREASVSGITQVRAGAVRPEIIVPHGESERALPMAVPSMELAIGSRVRVVRTPAFGEEGEVTELPNEPETLENGAVVRVLRVRLSSGRLMTVPRANIELM